MNHRLEIEIVIPVYNEERVLASTVRRLTEFLDRELPHGWRIVIANNRSTDRTSEIAASLSAVDARVSLLNLPKKGRGLAVREAWSRSHADIVSYMDADLSTDLRYFPLLVESVRQFYDIGVASRLLPASRVVRSLKRDQLSRAFNRLIRLLFGTHFSDTQCGFKAMKRDVARLLLPHVRSDGWFFDAELLVLAERNAFRIFELPVEWTEDLDSRVTLGPAAQEIFRELLRLRVRRLPRIVARTENPATSSAPLQHAEGEHPSIGPGRSLRRPGEE